MIRVFIGAALIRAGMAIIPKDTRDLVRGILLYHVPGALTEAEKAEIRTAKAEWQQAIPSFAMTERLEDFLTRRLAERGEELERVKTAVRDAIEALERGSTSSPVLECLRAALGDGEKAPNDD